MDQQLAVQPPRSFEEMEKLSKAAAASGMFGITKPEQAICLFAICQSEGLDPISALRRYHLIEGKPSMRADAMAAEFMAKGGAIIWHARTDDVCAATFFSDKSTLDDKARERSIARFEKLWDLDVEEDAKERTSIMGAIAKLSREGEETIIRTYEDAQEKGLTTSWKKNDKTNEYEEKEKTNWKQSPRQMLTARVVTEGVRLVNPGLIAGIYTPEEIQDTIHAEEVERAEFVDRALKDPDPRDRKAIEAMIDQYVADSKDAKPAEKSRLLGLAAELRTRLADMELESDEIPGIAKPKKEGVLPSASDPELALQGEPDRVPVPWIDYVLQHTTSKLLRGKRLGDMTGPEIAVIAKKSAPGLESEDENIRIEANYIKEANEALNPKEKK